MEEKRAPKSMKLKINYSWIHGLKKKKKPKFRVDFCYCRNPVGIIFPTTTVLNTKPAPEVAVFSSMGPNVITPEIIKVRLFSFLNLYLHISLKYFKKQ
jgi:hypothetical protein